MREAPEERRAREAREEREAHRKRMRRRRAGGGYALAALITGSTVAIVVAGLHGHSVDLEHQVRRSELASNLEALRAAQLDHESTNGAFLSLGSPVEAYDALAAGRPYVPDNGLRWAGANARGAYWVTLTREGFEAHGLLDADGDGIPAHWVATEAGPPSSLTGRDVY